MSIESSHGNYSPVAGGEGQPATPEELALLRSKVEQMWNQAYSASAPDVFPGFVTTTPNGRVQIQENEAAQLFRRTSLYMDAQGSWYFEQMGQRPAYELEGTGSVVRITKTWPLSGAEGTTATEEKGLLRSDGSLIVMECDTKWSGYVMTRRDLEYPHEVLDRIAASRLPKPQAPRGWLRRLFSGQ